jgi:hypothetical protein
MAPPTTSPSAPVAPVQAAPLPGTWSGPLAFINQPSSDGRYLALADPADLETRQMPIPLLYQADLAPGHDGGKQGLGVINRAWIQGNQLMGSGCFDMQDPVAADLARKVSDGFLGWTSVDLEPSFEVSQDLYDTGSGRLISSLSPAELAELAESGDLDINPVNYEDPPQVGADDQKAVEDDTIPIPSGRYSTPVTVFQGWKLMSATLVSQPAFADAKIGMDSPAPVTADAAPDSGPCPPGEDLEHARKASKKKGAASGAACAECGGTVKDELAKTRTKATKNGKKTMAGAPPEHGDGCECGASCSCTSLACECGSDTCSCTGARVAAATALDPELAGRHAQVAAVMARFRADGSFGLPVADGNPAWDAGAATQRIEKWASSDGSGDTGKIDWSKFGQAFLYKDPDGGDKVGDYSLPVADVIDGRLQIVPKGVFAVAGRLNQTDIPAAAKESVKGKVRSLYAAIGKKQGRKLPPPFDAAGPGMGVTVTDAGEQRGPVTIEKITDDDEEARDNLAQPDTPTDPTGAALSQTPVDAADDADEQGKPQPNNPIVDPPEITTGPRAAGGTGGALAVSPQGADTVHEQGKPMNNPVPNTPAIRRAAVVASAAPIDPPAAWFSDPALPGPTPIVITRSGRVMGHLALFDSCHTGVRNECVSPPRTKTGYSLFHVGSVVTREGDELAVGKIVLGTDHASTAASVTPQSAMAHYADTGYGVAIVRAGEDESGIWVAGSLVPEATEEQVAALRRSPLSGDWRRYGANLELIAALAVNAPGFPVPRAQARQENARVAALTAAGVLTPIEPASPCGGSGFEIDVDSLAEAVVARAEALQVRRAALKARQDRALATIAAGREESRRARAAAARRVALKVGA